ncbi:MAG: 3-dehydroquinate synthase II, partial [Methanothrix sp.]|nr:3-dehydroquinate synthase II [Methanothrix sp.]
MKEKWLMASEGPWEEMKPKITTALESGFDCVVTRQEDVEKVRTLGEIKVASFGTEREIEDILIIGRGGEGDGSVPLPEEFGASLDISLARATEGTVAGYVEIRSKRYEEFAVELGKNVDYLVVVGADWKVIPLENMIAHVYPPGPVPPPPPPPLITPIPTTPAVPPKVSGPTVIV